ncbi:hypothetical protein [Haloflavibacter putidus]|uniref:Uncharacterized protein n=1 Tax=Haloflavibacter putidus TaxID=2576776 RepID=A0A507ZSV2_9FLAO|nr:hypothetical protein [Haloflavibacter putidus]TQD40700.1 hypothetical protein FKR84_01590 [Haloflavibacter putidus]
MKKLLAVTALFLAFGFNSTDAIAKEKEQECAMQAWEIASTMCAVFECSDYEYWNTTNGLYEACLKDINNTKNLITFTLQ